MHIATLGGVPGVAEARSRRRAASTLDVRGTFWFRSQYEAAVVQLLDARRPVEFDGWVDGEPKHLKVMLLFLAAENGTVFFESSAEGT